MKQMLPQNMSDKKRKRFIFGVIERKAYKHSTYFAAGFCALAAISSLIIFFVLLVLYPKDGSLVEVKGTLASYSTTRASANNSNILFELKETEGKYAVASVLDKAFQFLNPGTSTVQVLVSDATGTEKNAKAGEVVRTGYRLVVDGLEIKSLEATKGLDRVGLVAALVSFFAFAFGVYLSFKFEHSESSR